MNWPTTVDYQDALQNPSTAFRQDFLRTGVIAKNPMGIPRPISGGFAKVYRMRTVHGDRAVRLFERVNPAQLEQIRRVDRFLLKQGALPGLIGCRIYEDEILVKGKRFPMQVMDWVDGCRLDIWVEDCVQKKDATALRKFADAWADLILRLGKRKLAHGDLQHGNVMVVKGQPVLIDYDEIFSPEIEAKPSKRAAAGLPAYQHPKRKDQLPSVEWDRFSAWIILIAVRAIAHDPSLYQRFVIATRNEDLLFTPKDHADPHKSDLWKELTAISDREIRDWATALFQSCGKSFDDVPPFTLDPFQLLREACAQEPRDWPRFAEIDRLRRHPTIADRVPPEDLKPILLEARQSVELHDRVEKALNRAAFAEVFGVAGTSGENLAVNDPLRPAVAKAAWQKAALDELTQLRTTTKTGRDFVARWEQLRREIESLPTAKPIADDAQRWKKRLDHLAAFLRELNSLRSERRLANAWDALEKSGSHPEAEPHKPRALLAKKRADALEKIAKLPREIGEAEDRRWDFPWDDAAFADCAEATPLRLHHTVAAQRRRLLDDLGRAIATADRTHGGKERYEAEHAAYDAAKALPGGYLASHRERMQRSVDWLKAVKKLKIALATAGVSERILAAHWEIVSRIPNPFEPAERERCLRAIRQTKALAEIEKIPATEPLHVQDELWGKLFDEDLFKGCVDADAHWPRNELARRRRRSWQELERALDERNWEELHRGNEDPILADYPPRLDRLDEITRILEQGEMHHAICRAFGTGTANESPTREMLDYLQKHHSVFAPAELQTIVTSLEGWLRDSGRLRHVPNGAFVVPGSYEVTIRWGWDFGLLTHCIIAWHPRDHINNPTDADPERWIQCDIEQFQNQGGGFRILASPTDRKLYVSIWPILDLGWTTLTGPPLHYDRVNLGLAAPAPNRSVVQRIVRLIGI